MAAFIAGVIFTLLGIALVLLWLIGMWAAANAMVMGVQLPQFWLPLVGAVASFAFAGWLFFS